MLLGKPPFDGDDSYGRRVQTLHEHPVPHVARPIPKLPGTPSFHISSYEVFSGQNAGRPLRRGFDLADALTLFLWNGTEARMRAPARRHRFHLLPDPFGKKNGQSSDLRNS